MFNIFEQPWTLLVVSIVVLCVMLMARSIFPDKRRWWQFAIPAFLAVAGFAFDFLVQTDYEKINAVINTAFKAVEKEDPDAIEAILADDYKDSYHNTKSRLMQRCRVMLAQPLIKKNYKSILTSEISQTKATVTLSVKTIFDKQSNVGQFNSIIVTKVKINLQKQADSSWLVNRIEILEFNRHPAKWKDIPTSLSL